jgi:hypothetical protein
MTYPPTSPKRIAIELLGSLLIAGLALAFLLSMSGCTLITPKVITTEIRKTENGFEIISPKDTDAFFMGKPDGWFLFRYSAKASPEALAAGSAESANRAAAVGKLAEAAASLK